ncbi:glycosyl transferase family 1 [Candidatus Saccharibacteria bacterium CG10_big_fil_rev_8_21_14_0_10_47_8]|nr:MAG: glycosyl transferase family 1 [Candidatus Saccharibacteria bacterium CG10_big_fil_rev_8_21_14_0_10_47_8]
MRRILIDARELRTSTGRYVERLLYYLQQIDEINDYVVLLKPKDFTGWHPVNPVNPNFSKVICPYKEFTFGEQLGLRRQINALKPDLVHFTMTQQPILYSGKTVTTIHDLTTARFYNPAKNHLVFYVKQIIYRRVIKRVARKSIKIITGSQYVKDDIARFTKVNPAKIHVTHEAADLITDKPEPLKQLAGKQFIMYLGRPQPHKNLRRLIDAFAILQKTQPELYLVLAGKKDALYAQHEQYVKKNGVKNVYFTGFVSEGQLRWLYENTAVYVFPSLSEGFGLPGLEAMVHGAPVASSNATCLPEIYGNAAIYFDPLDMNDMAAKMSEMLDNQKLRKKLIVAGKKQAGKYSWQRMAKQTLAIYREVLSR